MSEINIDQLLGPLPGESPAGEDLDLNPIESGLFEFQSACKGKPERQIGDTVEPAQEPKWTEILSEAAQLLGRSRDLRVAIAMTEAGVETRGLAGLADGLRVIDDYLANLWETVFPRLDAEDNDDPTLRVNTLSALSSLEFLRRLDRVELISADKLGRITVGDARDARTDSGRLSIDEVKGALLDCRTEALESQSAAVTASIEAIKRINKVVTDRVGVGNSCDFSPLLKRLTQISTLFEEPLARLSPQPLEPTPSEQPAQQTDGQTNGAVGPISSSKEAIAALENVIRYYEKNEPSSPIPLLLNRVRKIASKSFLEIMTELSPTSVKDLRTLGGIEEEEGAS
jgi:type VI secretion system protein ImpA